MKKLLVSAGILLLVLSVKTVEAQQNFVGVKGGVSLTSVTDLKGKDRVAGNVGLFFHHEINKNWCIQPEILYAGGGQKFTTDAGDSRVLALSYIQVPVMLQYYPVKKFYVEFGPQAGLLVNAETKNVGSGDKENESVKDYYKKGDFTLNAGAGVNITRNFGLYGRYNLGLTDNSKDATNRMNRGVQLGASIRF